jgi:hypothetical protein
LIKDARAESAMHIVSLADEGIESHPAPML